MWMMCLSMRTVIFFIFFLWKHCVSFLPQTCPSADKVPDLDRGGPTLFSAKKKKKKNINIVDKQATSACIIVVVK